jgi:hypothetical protein
VEFPSNKVTHPSLVLSALVVAESALEVSALEGLSALLQPIKTQKETSNWASLFFIFIFFLPLITEYILP